MATIKATTSDAQGRKGSKEFHLAASVTTVAGAQAAWDDILAAWPDVSDAGLSQPTVSFPLTGTPIAAVTGSNLDEVARIELTMATGVGNENYPLPCPTKQTAPPAFDFIEGGAVDPSNAELVTWFDLYATGDVLRIGVNSLRAVSSILGGYLER